MCLITYNKFMFTAIFQVATATNKLLYFQILGNCDQIELVHSEQTMRKKLRFTHLVFHALSVKPYNSIKNVIC